MKILRIIWGLFTSIFFDHAKWSKSEIESIDKQLSEYENELESVLGVLFIPPNAKYVPALYTQLAIISMRCYMLAKTISAFRGTGSSYVETYVKRVVKIHDRCVVATEKLKVTFPQYFPPKDGAEVPA